MDSKSPSNKEAKEVARELLIAISNSSPDKILDSSCVSERAKEVARELLISISDSSPDKILNSNCVTESKKSDGVVSMPNHDGDEKFRSELISLSYVESPDVKV